MTRVAIVTTGIASTLHADLGLAERLRARGDDVTVLSHADVGAVVEGCGVAFVGLTADREAFAELGALLDDIRRGALHRRLVAAVRLPIAAVRHRRRTAGAVELRDELRRIGPDLVVVDIEQHVGVAVGVGSGVPTALVTAYFALGERPGVPPVDSRHGPDEEEAILLDWGRVRHEAAAERRRRVRSPRVLVDLFGPVSYSTTSPIALRAVARRVGFDRSHVDTTQWLRPHGYRRIPILSTNLRELEFGDGGGPDWHYVGPLVGRPAPDARPTAAEPSTPANVDSHGVDQATADRRDAHAAWLDWNERRDAARPLVYCSLGSYWSSDLRLLGEIVGVARRHPERDLVIGLGGQGEVADLGDLPPNVLALRWAPQVDVLRHADAAIVHGGNAGLNECVVTGVPMVVCSTGHLDQNGVARRVEHHGLGLALDGARVGADDIEAALATCLDDPAIAGAVDRCRRIATGERYRSSALDALDDVLHGGGGRPAP